MSLRTKLLLISLLPIIAMSAAMAGVISFQSDRLSQAQVSAVKAMILRSKETELRNYVTLARTAIEPFYSSSWSTTPLAKRQVTDIINRMTFGQDGYFYVYEENGTNLVHPRLPELVGGNWIDLKDPNGQPVIRDLIENAKSGGSFYEYVWNKPSTGADADKIGYSVFLDKWKWMMGSGLYVDDIASQVATISDQLEMTIAETRWVLLALTLGAIVLSGTFIGGIRLSEQRMADQRLKELTSRLVDIQELERKRVSSELHDGISQLLVSVSYTLDAAREKAGNRKAVSQQLDAASATLENAIAEVRRISMDLRPSILDDVGLAAAITSLARDFSARSAIRVDVAAERVGAGIPDAAKTALYRVTQEALTNVARHSNASKVRIELGCAGQHVRLMIVDNGSGMPVESRRDAVQGNGLGLRNMRERIDSFGGKMEITEPRGGGLEIEILLPSSKPDSGRLAA
ncbi:MAG: cache domain-containing protein [Nitratireductor sp.]